jgi:hypothetical protein
MTNITKTIIALMALIWTLAYSTSAFAAEGDQAYVLGIKIRAGGRYDNVRRCVASSKGTPGGPAADISAFAEIPVGNDKALQIDLPVFRPILFAAAWGMLQFEPSATFRFRVADGGDIDWILGPTLGVSLHYGPDYQSDLHERKFFAMGPIIGGYVGLDFLEPKDTFNFELGLTPYIIPLFGVDDSKNHKGIVAGALLDASFRFKTSHD